MTESSCWIEFRKDRRRRKRNLEGWYGAHTESPIYGIPGPCPKNADWDYCLHKWCQSRNISVRDEFGPGGSQITRATVTQAQILDSLAFMFDDEPSYNDPAQMLFWKGTRMPSTLLINVKVFVARELRPNISYQLVADTW